MRCLGRAVLSVVAFAVGFVFAAYVGGWVQYKADLGSPNESEWTFLLMLLLFPVMPIAFGYACARGTLWVCRGRAGEKSHDSGASARLQWGRRMVIRIIAAAYLFTWMFGVPLVQTSLANETVAAYKQMKVSYPQEVSDSHPYMKSYMAFPILPGLIVTYHEHQLAYLSGFGGWLVHIWYFTGAKAILAVPSWVS